MDELKKTLWSYQDKYSPSGIVWLATSKVAGFHVCLWLQFGSVQCCLTTWILCGKLTKVELLENTFSTFYALNIVPQQQYWQRQYKTYSLLIFVLITVEQTNELLLKNHDLSLAINCFLVSFRWRTWCFSWLISTLPIMTLLFCIPYQWLQVFMQDVVVLIRALFGVQLLNTIQVTLKNN